MFIDHLEKQTCVLLSQNMTSHYIKACMSQNTHIFSYIHFYIPAYTQNTHTHMYIYIYTLPLNYFLNLSSGTSFFIYLSTLFVRFITKEQHSTNRVYWIVLILCSMIYYIVCYMIYSIIIYSYSITSCTILSLNYLYMLHDKQLFNSLRNVMRLHQIRTDSIRKEILYFTGSTCLLGCLLWNNPLCHLIIYHYHQTINIFKTHLHSNVIINLIPAVCYSGEHRWTWNGRFATAWVQFPISLLINWIPRSSWVGKTMSCPSISRYKH